MNYTPLLDTPLPIVAAPMAGGPTTPALVTAVAGAGGFGFLAGGYQTGDGLAAQIAEVRECTDRFGVNLFVPGESTLDRDAFRRYAAEVQPEGDAYGLELDPDPVSDDDRVEHASCGVLVCRSVARVSSQRGCGVRMAEGAQREVWARWSRDNACMARSNVVGNAARRR